MAIGGSTTRDYYPVSRNIIKLYLVNETIVTDINFAKLITVSDVDNHIKSMTYDGVDVESYDLEVSYPMPMDLGISKTIYHYKANAWV